MHQPLPKPLQPRPDRSPARYDPIQRIFHWTMAAIVIVAILLGLWASFLVPGTPLRQGILEIHKSLGISALLILLPRIAYRLLSKAPASDDDNRITRIAARVAHLALYALMLLMPVTGYIYSAAGGYSLPWFGLFQWPRLLAKDMSVARVGEMLHDTAGWIIAAVALLHIAAVAWHRFYRNDDVLHRMLPAPRNP